MNFLLLLSLLLSPLTAGAQVTFVSEDPNPNTVGCQNARAAFHQNGDVVMVDYHGQWREPPGQRPIQNGGHDYRGCEIERVYRKTPAGDLVWEIEPTNDPEERGFARHDRIGDLAAMPDGATVVIAHENISDDEMNVRVMLVDSKGARKWHTKTRRAPKFAHASVHASSTGELFIAYSYTNYGYDDGRFQLSAGPVYKTRKNSMGNVLARIDPTDGSVIWQKPVGGVVSVESGEVLYLDTRFKYGKPSRERHRINRMTYDAKPISSAWIKALENESLFSVQRFEDHLVMSTRVEHRRPQGGVKERSGRLRVFDFKGKLVSTREISDSTVLADRGTGCALHLVSPTECDRSLDKREFCRTRSLDVLTLDSLDDEGESSRIRVPRAVIDNARIHATSTRDGLWVSAETFYGRDRAPAVTVIQTRDKTRPRVDSRRFVWEPRPRKKSHQKKLEIMF